MGNTNLSLIIILFFFLVVLGRVGSVGPAHLDELHVLVSVISTQERKHVVHHLLLLHLLVNDANHVPDEDRSERGDEG